MIHNNRTWQVQKPSQIGIAVMVRIAIPLLLLLGLLTACTTSVIAPTYEIIQKGLQFQVEQTQQQLSQQLDLDFQGFEIRRLSITQQQPLTVQNLPTYHLRGTYDLTFKLPKRQLTQLKKPFELYLQLQKEGKTWRLLQPKLNAKGSPSVWRSYPLF